MTDKKRMHAIVHGRVQGVAFREYTRREAVELGLAGWVRNLADGTVEVEFEGETLQVEALLNWLAVGSPYALVTQVDAQEKPLEDETGLFSIRRSA